MNITLTDTAQSKLSAFVQSDSQETAPTKGIRVSVIDGGNGYEYSLGLVNRPKEDDQLLEQNNLRVYIDSKSAPLLQGVVIDYIEGLTQSGFKFSNSSADETCSCGKSAAAAGCNSSAKKNCG
ncbi:MAG: iron-sulfur cluster assembly accessory protein [Coleofasciculaceae cyanobacterium]